MSRPTWARRLTTISLVVAVIALVFTVRDIGLRTLGHYLHRIGWWWLLVVPMEMLTTTLDATSIRLFASPEKIKLRSTLLSQLAGRAVNAVTPTGNLGEGIKISVLTDVVSNARAVSTILLYNVVSFSVEMGMFAAAAPVLALLVPMSSGLRWCIVVGGTVAALISIGLYVLVHRGMLVSTVGLLHRLRIVSAARYERWQPKLHDVDDKMRLVQGARPRDRRLGIAAVIISRINSSCLSLMILHAVGEPITARLVAAYTVGSFVIYMLGTLVPMGIGINEGGYYELFNSLSHTPERGVTLALARRVTLVVYAGIGLILVTASETVQRARERHKIPAPRIVTSPPQVTPAAVTKAAE